MTDIIGVVTFKDTEAAGKFVATLGDWEKQNLLEVEDAVIVVKDAEGNLTVHETKHSSSKRGAVKGGAAGFIIGAVIGGPIGGALLGSAAGAIFAKKVDLGVPNEKIELLTESMTASSSALLTHLKNVSKQEMLSAAVRHYEGEVIEVELTEATQANVDQMILNYDAANR